MKIEVCLSPALYPYYHQSEAIVIVTDIFRATTTMIAAFESGAALIRPVERLEEAAVYKAEGWLVGAERNVERCEFADFGNSPFDYSPEKVKGKEIVMTTTNGTKAISMAQQAHQVIIGAFLNLQAVVDYCLLQKRDVIVLCSGWNDQVNIEDSLFGGAVVDLLLQAGYLPASDAARIAYDMWRNHQADALHYVSESDHYARLKAHRLEEVVPYCLTLNISRKVPRLFIENNVLYLK